MAKPTTQIELESLSGPHPASFTASSARAVTIGRAATNDVCLLADAVSRKHATVVYRSGEWFVVDHASRVGTMLNGVKLEPSRPSSLASGDLLKIGPWTFRANFGPSSTVLAKTVDDAKAGAPRISRVGVRHSRSEVRLQLLGECMGKLAGATDESTLAKLVLDSALRGSGFARGAVLKRIGSGEEVQIVESARRNAAETSAFEFSRSLVKQAEGGEAAVMTVDRVDHGQHSIAELRIHSAMCVPLFLAGAVEGYLYLDARGQEDQVNSEAMGFCEAIGRAYGLAMSNLKRIELHSRQQSMERDLDAAREAQQVMLPPPEGELGPIRYAVQMRPGMFVAGDLFDVVPLSADRIAVTVGDVAGHGVGSAMLMALAQSYLHAQLLALGDAAEAVTAVNRFVAERSTAGRFASVWVGIFTRADGGWRVDFVDAGHGHWLLKSAAEGTVRPVTAKGAIPIGVVPDRDFQSETLLMGENDRLILYTDGIVEQRNAAGEQFGRDRLAAAISASSSSAGDVRAAFEAIDAFGGGGGLDDDATVAAIEFA